jgi:hypothetical protein
MPDDWQLEHWQIVLHTVAFAAHHYCPGLTYQRVTLGFVRHDCREPQRASLVYVSGSFKPHSWLRLSCGLKERITDSGPCFSSFCMPPAGWHRRSCEWRPRATTPPRAYRVAVSTVPGTTAETESAGAARMHAWAPHSVKRSMSSVLRDKVHRCRSSQHASSRGIDVPSGPEVLSWHRQDDTDSRRGRRSFSFRLSCSPTMQSKGNDPWSMA